MKVCTYCLIAALLGPTLAWGQAGDTPRGRTEAESGVQVLTRGPVHEAFAETVTFDPEPGIVVPKAPPAAIEELPPAQKPEGANVAWIPGYWGWDDERSDFLWVSGVWRALPPGRQWVPGYWGRSAQGFQWISGYWADASLSEVEYLPEPPGTVEIGPNIAASSADQTWLPGCWVWQQNRYAWRPGFWASVEPDWVWVPAHYVYAPRGYVFVDGYWDYTIDRRGVLFAPVYFDANVYRRPGFSYSPTTAVDLGTFVSHLFLRPRYQHYYFGDYYATDYRSAGFLPWFSINTGRSGYDPIYAHQHWQHRQDSGWEHRQQADFENRRDHENLRPPRTWENQGEIRGGGVASLVRDIVDASRDQGSPSRNSAWRFQPVDQAERQRVAQQRADVYRFRDQRQQWENQAAVAPVEGPAHRGEPARMKLPRSPIAAGSPDQLGKGPIPPRAYAAPAVDSMVQPKPRGNHSPEQPRQRTTLRMPLDTKQPPVNTPPSRVKQATPQPQPQPKAEQPAPQPQPRPQPKVERPAPPPAAGPASAGPSKEDKKGKGQERGNARGKGKDK
ncbi:MAG: hypothetical protein ACYC6Y_16235 [Thermoguttaceae bacterium]